MDGSETETDPGAGIAGMKIAGTWFLEDCRMTYAGGRAVRPWGRSATGCLIYAPDGHVCGTLTYPGPKGRLTARSFCGAYSVSGDRIRHRIIASNDIAEIGTVQERGIAIVGDRLTLTASPAPAGGPGSTIAYQWRRAGPVASHGASHARAAAGKSFNDGP